jgi:hypothetical protein
MYPVPAKLEIDDEVIDCLVLGRTPEEQLLVSVSAEYLRGGDDGRLKTVKENYKGGPCATIRVDKDAVDVIKN